MSLSEVRKQAYKLSVLERLELVEDIVRSLSRELRPRPPLPEDIVERMTGLLKTDAPPPTDAEVETMLEESLAEKYLK